MGLAGLVKEIYSKTVGGTPPDGAAAAAGDVSQMVKYLVANPGGLSFNSVAFPWATTFLSQLSRTAGIFQFISSNGVVYNNTNAGASTKNYIIAVYDSTAKQPYMRNTTANKSWLSSDWSASGGVHLSPNGPSNLTSANMALTNIGAALPAVQFNTLVTEFEFAQPIASVSNADTGYGIAALIFSTANILGGTSKHIGFYRKTGSGWTAKSGDGSTSSETSESSDTSDGNKHTARLEFENKATPELRLYIDGVIKVTKTTNLPPIGLTTGLASHGFSADTALATDALRYYCNVIYWKVSA